MITSDAITRTTQPWVKREAGNLLDGSTPEERRAWLATGYRLAQAEDDRVAFARILATSGISDATRQTISDLLDENSPEDMRAYLAADQHDRAYSPRAFARVAVRQVVERAEHSSELQR